MSGAGQNPARQTTGVSAVAIDGRAVMLCGASGSGKSALALALIDRGAELIGDDALGLRREGEHVLLYPPPNIAGKIELRGVGILDMATTSAPLALILDLDGEPVRYPLTLEHRQVEGVEIPVLPFAASGENAALRARYALEIHGLNLQGGANASSPRPDSAQ